MQSSFKESKECRALSKNLKQKARLRWADEGDENTKFFHPVVKAKRSGNTIRGLLLDGAWSEDPKIIKKAAYQHFKQQFSESNKNIPIFVSQSFKKLKEEQQLSLENPFTELEIRNAVWQRSGGKAPGPDGFNFNFIKANWELIKSEVIAAVLKFEATGAFGAGCNPSFIGVGVQIEASTILYLLKLLAAQWRLYHSLTWGSQLVLI